MLVDQSDLSEMCWVDFWVEVAAEQPMMMTST